VDTFEDGTDGVLGVDLLDDEALPLAGMSVHLSLNGAGYR
jgi:hypothetical protein